MTQVRPVTSPAELATAYAIRAEVFVEEQAVPVELERDQHDETAAHVLAFAEGRAVGTGRLVVEPGGTAHLGRLAVLPGARGTGVGVALVRALEDHARHLGLRRALLGAQTHAIAFYERLGYVADGPEFDDAGIPHRWMHRGL